MEGWRQGLESLQEGQRVGLVGRAQLQGQAGGCSAPRLLPLGFRCPEYRRLVDVVLLGAAGVGHVAHGVCLGPRPLELGRRLGQLHPPVRQGPADLFVSGFVVWLVRRASGG